MWIPLGECCYIFGRCVFALLIKNIFVRAYAIENRQGMKLESSLSYCGSLNRKDFSKIHQINPASLVHLANYTLHLANTNKFLINSLTDSFTLIQKTAKRASIFWNQKFPSALLDLKKIMVLAPHSEVMEINALPLHRFCQPKPEGIERSKWIELAISHKSFAKIIRSHFKIDIEEPNPMPTDPRTLDPNIYKILRGFIYSLDQNSSISKLTKISGLPKAPEGLFFLHFTNQIGFPQDSHSIEEKDTLLPATVSVSQISWTEHSHLTTHFSPHTTTSYAYFTHLTSPHSPRSNTTHMTSTPVCACMHAHQHFFWPCMHACAHPIF